MSDDEEEKESKERISIFIDGSNLYHSLKRIGISKINFQKLVDKLINGRQLISVFYYNAPLDITMDPERY